ncbi:hypothetical protein Pint_31378 [Pistacia integerrima]|uniref:Uncharacterized protein n=1 Tax=Pistacia integerrima TaxID=434235 RepID=A0ACC0XNR7_9ROSI|nr:hypothetical protein Pint_31378 [Pistacia integerrima]
MIIFLSVPSIICFSFIYCFVCRNNGRVIIRLDYFLLFWI